MPRTKFNVDKDTFGRTLNGKIFDSELEMRYYRDVITPGVACGKIKNVELQKTYVLQPKFKHCDKTILPIEYDIDFYVEYSNGDIDVIDTKGFAEPLAKIKRKIFLYKYPELNLRWICHVKKYGGWIDYDELQKLRRACKKNGGKVNNE